MLQAKTGTMGTNNQTIDRSLPPARSSDTEVANHSNPRAETLRVVKTNAEIEELREVWVSWFRHPHSDGDSYLIQNRLAPCILRPHVMVVYREGKPDCMLLGRLQLGGMGVSLGGAQIALPCARVLHFLSDGFLGNQSTQNSNFLTQGILSSLRHGEADLAELSHVRLDSALYQAARSFPGMLYRDHFPLRVTHRSLILRRSFQEFLDSLSRKKRHNLRTYSKRLLREFSGDVSVRCLRREDELADLFRCVDEIARKTYQWKLGLGFVNSSEIREELTTEARKGRLNGYVLYLNEKPAAFIIGTSYQGTFFGRFMGYDPEHGKYSPGSFLFMHCIQEFCANGNGQTIGVDFGPGNQGFKRIISNQEWQEATIDIFAPTLKALRFNVLRTSLVVVNHVARSFLVRTSLRDKATKKWHSILQRKLNGKTPM